MRLFVSYAKANKPQVEQLVTILRAGGHEPWYDFGLLPGQDWQGELLRQITACEAFVYALTPESVASEWCQWEFAEAVKLGRPVIPVLLAPVADLPASLSAIQYADLTQHPEREQEIARLIGGIYRFAVIIPVGQVSAPPREPAGVPAQAAVPDKAVITPENAAHVQQTAILLGGDEMMSVTFSPDGRLLAAACSSGVRVWDTQTYSMRVLKEHWGGYYSVAFSPDGQWLAAPAAMFAVHVWNVTSGAKQALLIGHQEIIKSVTFTPDGAFLAVGYEDATVRLWNTETWETQMVLEPVGDSMAFSPDGRLLATASKDGALWLRDASSGYAAPRRLATHAGPVWLVACSHDGRWLASVSHEIGVQLWSTEKGELAAMLPSENVENSVVFSPDGRLLAVAYEDATVRLWEWQAGIERAVLSDHTEWVWSVAFSPDGRLVASASADNTIRLWGLPG